MSKAILIMDMPSNCSKCQFVKHEDEGWLTCSLCDYRVAYVCERADYCPLKEVPKQREEKMASDIGLRDCGFIDGWNSCIDEILGES